MSKPVRAPVRRVDYFYDKCSLSMRDSERYAVAEQWAHENGYTFEWDISETDSSDFSDETPAWQLWDCVMRDEDGKVVQSLGAIDFGRDGEPWGEPYMYQVQAELAMEERKA